MHAIRITYDSFENHILPNQLSSNTHMLSIEPRKRTTGALLVTSNATAHCNGMRSIENALCHSFSHSAGNLSRARFRAMNWHMTNAYTEDILISHTISLSTKYGKFHYYFEKGGILFECDC